MAKIRLTARAVSDLERIFEFLAASDPDRALTVIQRIREAIEILAQHPLIGRPAEAGRRELVISRGRDAYVALYRCVPATESILVLAIRSAREAGYPDE
jgi:plasmid stabilization system protein ParE